MDYSKILERHGVAMLYPRDNLECALVSLMKSLEDPTYNRCEILRAVTLYRSWYLRSYHVEVVGDYVLGAGIAKILSATTSQGLAEGIAILLNGETGRLDAGEISKVLARHLDA